MGSRFAIRTPRDYLLKRDACSYGYFLLEPNHWDPSAGTFSRVLELGQGPATIKLAQPGDRRGVPLAAVADRALRPKERAEAKAQIVRMLRLDEDHGTVAAFHRADPRFRKSGRGRLMRSPTLFEDIIKTVTSCNVAWPSTCRMNERLCEVLGRAGEFPAASRVARTRPQKLRARCSVGYRDRRIVELAGLFVDGARGRAGGVDVGWFEDPSTPDGAIHERLLELPGIGPYAAANIMQLLGRYARLPLDTESIRHGKTVLGYTGNDRQIMKAVHAHFAPFKEHAFRSYWFELWRFYEEQRGPSWTWEKATVGKTFTAAQFKAER